MRMHFARSGPICDWFLLQILAARSLSCFGKFVKVQMVDVSSADKVLWSLIKQGPKMYHSAAYLMVLSLNLNRCNLSHDNF